MKRIYIYIATLALAIGVGLGATVVQKVRYFGIIELSPAHTAGLKVGDEIKTVNGETTDKRSAQDVMDIISGTPGSELNLEILRPGHTDVMAIKITRGGLEGKNVPYSGIVAPN